MFNQKIYVSQVELLLQCLPSVATEASFAIKGGTAINLFIRDLPRFVGGHRLGLFTNRR